MKIKNIIIALVTALLSFSAMPASAQDLLVYHVVSGAKNKVKYTDSGKEVQRNDKVTLATKITVQFDCMVEILDTKNNKRYTIQKPGTGTIKTLASSNGSVANLTQKYVAYVKSQMSRKSNGMQSPQQLYDYATVTRTVMKKKDDITENSFEAEFNEFSRNAQEEFDAFVRQIDEEYTDFVAKAWKEFEAFAPVPRPVEKQVKPQVKPIKPADINKDEEVKVDKLKIDVVENVKRVVNIPKNNDESFFKNQPKPLREIKVNPKTKKPTIGIEMPDLDIPEDEMPDLNIMQDPELEEAFKLDGDMKGQSVLQGKSSCIPGVKLVNPTVSTDPAIMYSYMPFTFCGTDMQVRLDESKRFAIGSGLGENGKFNPQLVANVLKGLSSGEYNALVDDCIAIRDELHLGDWAYLQMLKTITDQFCGAGTNEAALLMGYVYYKSGYRARFAYSTELKRVFLLYGSNYSIYDKPSYFLDGISYYGVEELPSTLSLCEVEYPEERSLSLYTPSTQKFDVDEGEKRTIVSKRFPDFKIVVSVNKNLMEFCGTVPASYCDDDPETQWNAYANNPMDDEVKDQIYPVLKKLLEGKTETGKINRLLDLIQNGMEYEYDDVVWGVADRIFYPEESLFYKYCDCEDRSILFTRLVRDLVGLPCALVHYQGHLGAAVAFSEDVPGVSWLVDGKKYTICDPTYIGARCGEEMDIVDHNTAVLITLPK